MNSTHSKNKRQQSENKGFPYKLENEIYRFCSQNFFHHHFFGPSSSPGCGEIDIVKAGDNDDEKCDD